MCYVLEYSSPVFVDYLLSCLVYLLLPPYDNRCKSFVGLIDFAVVVLYNFPQAWWLKSRIKSLVLSDMNHDLIYVGINQHLVAACCAWYQCLTAVEQVPRVLPSSWY